MTFTNEGQLYEAVTDAIKEIEALFRTRPDHKDWLGGDFRSLEKTLDGHHLHLLGEAHYSRKPIDYIHQHLVSRIEGNPHTWLVLREDTKIAIEDPSDYPTYFYIRGLAKLFGLPYEDALASLYAPDTRAYILRKAGISEEDIDRLVLTMCLDSETLEDYREDFKGLVNLMSQDLQRSPEYTRRLLLMGPKNDLDFGEVIGKHWNDYSREMLHGLLKRYPDRTEVLVSVGYEHFPVFE